MQMRSLAPLVTSLTILALLTACGNIGSGSGGGKASGILDTSFGTEPGFVGSVDRLVVQGTKGILAAGRITSFKGQSIPYITRLQSDGTQDATFATNLGTGPNDSVFGVAVASDDSIYIGGDFTSVKGTGSLRIAKLGSDGTPDASFMATTSPRGFDGRVACIALDSSGNLLVGGEFGTYAANNSRGLAKLSADGTIDLSFANTLGTGFDLGVNTVLPESNGHILVGGSFTIFHGQTRKRLLRLNADGSDDLAFNTVIGTGFNGGVNTVALASDGSYLVGGDFTALNGQTVPRLVKITNSGALDTSFMTNISTGPNATVRSIVVESDGSILVAGDFQTFANATAGGIIRLDSTGATNADFLTTIGSGFDLSVASLALQSDGNILAGGSFTKFHDQTATRISRLK
ncbi:MAG: hypothetical protein JST16_07720 [Bdellovibrionales bacterium]|nr:hypothetical protein [Bdellovibrionales bacterium]